MTVFHADMSGLWMIFFVLFAVVPAIKWGFRSRAGWWHGRWQDHWGQWELEGRAKRRGGSRSLNGLRGELEERLAEIDGLHSRVAELENRLDFTERLLAQQRSSVAVHPTAIPVAMRSDPPSQAEAVQ